MCEEDTLFMEDDEPQRRAEKEDARRSEASKQGVDVPNQDMNAPNEEVKEDD